MNKKLFRIISLVLIILMLFTGCSFQKEKPSLSNPNASAEAKKLYDLLYYPNEEFGVALSAQQESTWMGSEDYEFSYIYERTGKTPVIRGFDYMNDDFDGVNKWASKWHGNGGFVTFCWHCGSEFSGDW